MQAATGATDILTLTSDQGISHPLVPKGGGSMDLRQKNTCSAEFCDECYPIYTKNTRIQSKNKQTNKQITVSKWWPNDGFRVYTTIYVREAASGKSLSQL